MRPRRARFASVVFDADSTLAALEGVDWLAALRSPEMARTVETLTQRAMAGEIALESVYASRLDVIRPTQAEIVRLGDAYVAAIEPGARELCADLLQAGVRVAIVSGGLREALLPLAAALGLGPEAVQAVDLVFDDAGTFASLAAAQLLATQGGKPGAVRRLRLPHPSVMIGDGSTDAAVRGETDAFIAYTGVARRLPVVALADAEARNFSDLTRLLFERTGEDHAA